jgi:group I intron endonuclease
MASLYLYKITNTLNGKMYIGMTTRPERRKYEHLRKKSGSFNLVRLAVAKYGEAAFSFDVLVEGSHDYISDLEVKAIRHFNTIAYGYNIQEGGSPEKGSTVKHRSDDVPILAGGFWFPNPRVAIDALAINKKTFYRRKALGDLHLEYKTLKAIKRPKRNSLEDVSKRSESMTGKNAGNANGMFGKTNTARSRAVIIEGIRHASINEAVRQTAYTKSQIEKRIKKGNKDFLYETP